MARRRYVSIAADTESRGSAQDHDAMKMMLVEQSRGPHMYPMS